MARAGLARGSVSLHETSDFNPRFWWDKDVQRHYARLNRAGFQPWLSRRRNEVRFRGAHSALWNKCQVSRRKVCFLVAREPAAARKTFLSQAFPALTRWVT